jgi:integrase/recombinase XerD
MDTFKTYLQEKGFAKATVYQHCRYVLQFLGWLQKEQINPSDCSYNDLLSWIDQLKQSGDSIKLVNRKLLSVRHWFSFFQLRNKEAANPATGLYLKSGSKRLVSGIISFDKLEQLYQSYQITDARTLRNKVILSLLIYQGITTDELHRLKTEDIKLREGKVKIPGSKRSNGRVLHLQAFQVLDIQEYLLTVRPKLTTEKEGRLFLSMEGKPELKNSLHHLFRALKLFDEQISSANQIRQSVITYWLKNHNLRQVQYMAGHKYVSSTERYQQNNIEDLQKEVNKYHPLNNNPQPIPRRPTV